MFSAKANFDELEKLKQKIIEIKNELSGMQSGGKTSGSSALAKELRTLQAEYMKQSEAAQIAVKQLEQLKQKYDAQGATIAGLEKHLQSLNERLRSGGNGIVSPEYKAMETRLRELEAAYDAVINKQRQTVSSIQSGAQQVAGSAGLLGKLPQQLREMFSGNAVDSSTFVAKINEQKAVLRSLEVQLIGVKEKMQDVNKISPVNAAAAQKIEQARKAYVDIRNEVAEQKRVIRELDALYNKLFGDATQKTESFLTVQRKLREEMMSLRNADGTISPENIARYDELRKKLQEVGTAYRMVRNEQRALTTGGTQIAGIVSGMSGLAGAFTAAQGAMTLFAEKNEDLIRIQTKMQAAMSITMGLQAIANTMHQTSAFRITTVATMQQWWTGVIAKANAALLASTAVGKAAAAAEDKLTAAHARVAAATAIVEKQEIRRGIASVAAYTRMDNAQKSLIKAQAAHAAATSAQAAAARTATVANTGLAGSLMLVWTTIKSIPGWGWMIAGVSAIAGLVVAYRNLTKTQREFNQVKAKADKDTISEITRLNTLESILKNTNNSYQMRNEALLKLKEIMPSYNAELRKEGELINDNTGSLKKYIEQLGNTSMAKIYSEKFAEAKLKYEEYMRSLGKADREIVAARISGDFSDNLGGSESMRLRYEKALKYYEEFNRLQKKVEEYTEKSLVTNIPEYGTKGYWEKQQADALALLNTMKDVEKGSEKWLEAQRKYKEATEKLKAWDLSGKAESTAENEAQKRINAALKLAEQERRIENERLRFKNEMSQKELDMEDDSFRKRMKQNDLDYEKEKQAIKERGEAMLKELQQAERTSWEANGKKGVFTPSVTELPADMADQIAQEYAAAANAHAAGEAKIREEIVKMREEERLRFASELDIQLSEIEEYYKKRIALAAGNEKLIAELEANREREAANARSENHLQQAIRSIDYGEALGIKTVTTKELKVIKKFFGDVEKIGLSSIKKTKDQLQTVLGYARGEITVLPEELQSLFGSINDGSEASEKRVEDLVKRFKELDEQEKRIAKDNPFKAIIKGFNEFKEAEKGSEEQVSALSDVLAGFDAVGSAFTKVGEAMKAMGITAGEVVVDIGNVISSTASMAAAGGQVGGGWGAVVGAVLGLASSLIPALAQTEKMSEEATHYYDSMVEVIDVLIDREMELLRAATGATAELAKQNALLYKEDELEKERERWAANFLASSGSKHSDRYKTTARFRDNFMYAVGDSLDEKGVTSGSKYMEALRKYKKYADARFATEMQYINPDLVAAAFGISREQLDYLKERGIDLADFIDKTEKTLREITPDHALALMETPEIWGLFDEETQNYLRAVIEHAEEVKQLALEAREAITGLTFDELSGSLDSLVTDSELSFEKIGKSFNDIMSKSILSFIKKKYIIAALEEWHKSLEDAWSDGDITEEEAEALRKKYEDIVTEGNRKYLAAKDITRITDDSDDSDDSENTLKGAYAKASQESIDLLAGQTGALRRVVEQIYAILHERYALPAGFIESVMGGMSAIPELIASGLHELVAIKELNARIAESNDLTVANTQRIGEITQRIEGCVEIVSGKLDVLESIADNTGGVLKIGDETKAAADSLRNIERGVNVNMKGL